MEIKEGLEKFLFKHPRLTNFIWGKPCPKCDCLMQIWNVDYIQCPKCDYKEYK